MLSSLASRLGTKGTPDLRRVIWGLHLICTLTAMAALYAGWVGISAAERYADSLQSQHNEAVAAIRDAEAIKARCTALQEKVTAVRERAAAVLARLPEGAQEAEFLKQLSGVAESSQLTLRDFRPGSIREQPTHSEMEVYVRLDGTFASLCRFIAELRHMSRVCYVSQLTISAPAGSEGISQIELHIVLAFGLKRATTA